MAMVIWPCFGKSVFARSSLLQNADFFTGTDRRKSISPPGFYIKLI